MTEPTDTPTPSAGTRYRIALDAPSASRLVDYVVAEADRAGAEAPPDVELVPSNLEPGDTVAVGEQTGNDREDAVGRLLARGALPPAGGKPSAIIQRRRHTAALAAHDGIPLTFVVSAAGNVGDVPVELDRRLKIG